MKNDCRVRGGEYAVGQSGWKQCTTGWRLELSRSTDNHAGVTYSSCVHLVLEVHTSVGKFTIRNGNAMTRKRQMTPLGNQLGTLRNARCYVRIVMNNLLYICMHLEFSGCGAAVYSELPYLITSSTVCRRRISHTTVSSMCVSYQVPLSVHYLMLYIK
jgi:hypothetical protein